MNHQEKARERARLLTEWADGKILQGFVNGVWTDWDDNEAPLMTDPSEWRVKPEPRRKWERVITYSSGASSSTSTTDNPDVAAGWKSVGSGVVTEWQEVLND